MFQQLGRHSRAVNNSMFEMSGATTLLKMAANESFKTEKVARTMADVQKLLLSLRLFNPRVSTTLIYQPIVVVFGRN